MKRVTGLGGIFFKAEDPKALQAWYERHLGLAADPDGSVVLRWRELERPEETGYTVWAPFRQDTTYFEPSQRPYMVNFRVKDLEAVLAQLRQEGVTVDERREDSEFGRFGWVMDPEGNRIELWEPPEEKKPRIVRVAEYTVAEGREAEAEAAIATFVAAVAANEPRTRYEAWRREGGRAFVHLMTFPDEAARDAHRQAEYTGRFVQALYPLCEQAPSFTDLVPVYARES